MKQKFKTISKLVILSLFIILNSCQKDDILENNNNSQNTYRVKEYSFKQASQNSKFNNAYKNINDKIAKKRTVSKSNSPIIDNNFTIDSTTVKEINFQNTTTYTMFINRNQPSNEYFENLIIKVEESDSIKAYTIKYFKNQELKYNNQHNSYGFKGHTEITEIQYDSSIFTPTFVDAGGCSMNLMCCWGGTEHAAGGNCSNTYWVIDCSGSEEGGGGVPSGPSGGTGTGGAGTSGNTGPGGSGSGSGTSTSITPIPTATVTPTVTQAINSFVLSLSPQQQLWWNNPANTDLVNQIKAFLAKKFPNITLEDFEFGNWAVTYLMANPNVTAQQFQNWFSTKKVGIESNETQNTIFWNNPNLTFPQQSLPTFDNFYSAYPSSSTTAKQLCTQIGGKILELHNEIIATGNDMNTCAVRLSYALNYSGIIIPNVPNTKLGGDGKYYFTFASHINTWMRETFGTNSSTGIGPLNNSHQNFTKQQILNNPLILNGLQGIFSMTSTNLNWSSGHCDLLFNDSTCLNNCHFEGPINYIDVWILP